MNDFEVTPIDEEGPSIIDELPTEDTDEEPVIDDIQDDPSVPEGGEPESTEEAPEPEPDLLMYASEVDELPTEDTDEEPVIDDEPDGGEQPYEPDINENVADIPIVGSAREGDVIPVLMRSGAPLGISPVGWGDRMQSDVDLASQAATEAKAVAQATGQHFWEDDNGAHVTEITKDNWKAEEAKETPFADVSDAKPYHNLLMNSLGILLRTALKNLVSITRSAIAFFDGEGNNAANVVASFGPSTLELAKNNKNASIKMLNGKASISALDMLRAGAAFGMQAAEVALKGTSSFYLQGGVHPKSGGLGNIVSIYNDGGNALIDSLRAPFEDDGSYPISGSYLSRILVHSENGIFLRPGVKGKVYISEPNDTGGWSVNRKIRVQPDTLYNNTSGSNGTITLSKSSANYTHMRIYFRTDDGTAYQTAKDVYSPNGKYVPLSAATTVQAQNQTWLKTRLVKISGTSITTDTTRYANTNVTYYSEFQKTNLIYITRVEAWNE